MYMKERGTTIAPSATDHSRGGGDLKKHIRRVHENKRSSKCTICDKSFSQEGYLKTHIKAVHEGEKNKCTNCDKVFSWGVSLKKHIKIAHEIE